MTIQMRRLSRLAAISLLCAMSLTAISCVALRQVDSSRQSPISIRWIAPADPAPDQALETAASLQPTSAAPAITTLPQSSAQSYTVGPGVLLRTPRMWHTTTRLADGRILLVGGSQAVDDFVAGVDILDPATGQTKPAAPLHRPRHAHSATLLQDGRVLVVGGYALPWQWLDDAEVYDPIQDTWTETPPLYAHGVTHTATVMQDGRVLVVGGNIGSGLFTARAEIFDPQTLSWVEAPSLPAERADHSAQLLNDGRVLVAGGQTDASGLVGGDALLYDPKADTWSATGPMVKPRIWGQSTLLGDGRVLVTGGMTLEDMPQNAFTAHSETYDPATNTWSAATAMAQPRYSHFLFSLPSGEAVVLGGARDPDCCWTGDSFVRAVEVYDPAADAWRVVAELPQPRAQAAAALMPNGCIWLSGGRWLYTTHAADSWLICPKEPW
jgi:N-acetylneuraminic acid mutarotase